MSPPEPKTHRPGINPTDLTNCDREAIHMLGRVQSYGALLAVSSDWIVQHASQNLETILNIKARDAVGVSLGALLGIDALERIREQMRAVEGNKGAARIFDFPMGRQSYDMSIHQSGRHLIFEFEPHGKRPDQDALTMTYPLIQRVREAKTFEDMCREGARGMQALSGFDTVIAEAKRDDSPSYLGLRFPATDIPQQARELYTRSLLRLIADVSDTGAAILPERTPEGEGIDLSLAVTRAVSPIHIEYLRNMGVKASMSVSILKDGDLWGLFACHHRSAHYIPFEKRTAIELFGHLFSYELLSFEERQVRQTEAKAARLQNALLMQVADGSSFERSLRGLSDELQSAIPHDGVMIYTGGTLSRWGATPPEEDIAELLRFLNTTAASQVFATHSLSEEFPDAMAYLPHCAGILAIPASRNPRDYLILCRRETAHEVQWAGKPLKSEEVQGKNVRLSPRKSFEAWKETVIGQSEPWSDHDHHAAQQLRTLLLEVLLRISDETGEEQRRSHERQETLISELNHRMRNILNLMRGLISQSRYDDLNVDTFAKSLDGRIHALALANDQLTRKAWAPLPLSELLALEFAAYSGSETDRLRLTGDDVLLSSDAYTTLALVIHELVTNSVKHGALGAKDGHVAVTLSRTEKRGLEIDWREVGGPRIAPPKRRGFGSAIIESSIPYELGGDADVHFDAEGLHARFAVPGSFLTEPNKFEKYFSAEPGEGD